MFRWLVRWLLRPIWSERKRSAPPSTKSAPTPPREYKPHHMPLPEFVGDSDPPPLHWKACHPSVIKRFKAEMTCDHGHGLVLKGHSVSEKGYVWPSVVCLTKGCTFHTFVRLDGWKFGKIGRH